MDLAQCAGLLSCDMGGEGLRGHGGGSGSVRSRVLGVRKEMEATEAEAENVTSQSNAQSSYDLL